jgi:hypothetical protein
VEKARTLEVQMLTRFRELSAERRTPGQSAARELTPAS